ncbi:MAG TPA: hypothetical protein VFF43_18320 [Caldimonas sp.]|nr:hypothetical protein [Caldimonas sp.]
MTRRARAVVAASLVAITAGAWSASPTHKSTSTPAPAPRASAAAASAPASAAAAAPVEFAGTFATGTTYVGEVFYDARALKTWRPVKDVQPGTNVAWTVRWDNIDQFPALKTAAGQARTQRFRFRVVKTDIVSGSPKMPWMATYHCELLGAEPVAVPSAQTLHQQQQAKPRR